MNVGTTSSEWVVILLRVSVIDCSVQARIPSGDKPAGSRKYTFRDTHVRRRAVLPHRMLVRKTDAVRSETRRYEAIFNDIADRKIN